MNKIQEIVGWASISRLPNENGDMMDSLDFEAMLTDKIEGLMTTEIENKYDPKHGDNIKCKCGHSYHRHFDSYEEMDPIGCKYCDCSEFEEV